MIDGILGMVEAIEEAKRKGLNNMQISAPLVLEMGLRVISTDTELFNAQRQLRDAESILRDLDVLKCSSHECNCGSYH